MKPRSGFNPKRRIAAEDAFSSEKLQEWRRKARYGGNPEHKKNPHAYGLEQCKHPRPAKTLCDEGREFEKAEAEGLLRTGLSKGLISILLDGHWPKNVWAVSESGEVFETQLENREQGAYHGYPVPLHDDFRATVLKEWNARGQ